MESALSQKEVVEAVEVGLGPITIIAVVKFNDGEAFVLSRAPIFQYERIGSDILYAEDSGFFNIYKKGYMRGFQAFGGRKFDIHLKDGSVEKATGQWWDGGVGKVSESLGVNLCHVTYGTIEELQDCYVYYGASADAETMKRLRAEYTGCVYPCRDYEMVINYWKDRRAAFKKQFKLEKDKRHLINQVKAKHREVTTLQQRLSIYEP